MASAPRLAPKLTLNLVDGDQYTLRITLTNLTTKARLDLTGCKLAWQVRKAFGADPLLTLATDLYTGFTNDTGCSITILDQTAPATKGQADCTFDLKANELATTDFTAETTDGVTRYVGVHDLQMEDSGGQTRTYLRGTAVFRQEVAEVTP